MPKSNVSKLLLLSAAVAAANTHARTEVEHVLVSGVLHKTEAQTALPVTLLTGKELKDRATSTLGDTLANEPGIANASFGPAVGQPVIRGQQGPRVTVLQNGTGSGDISSNSPDHAVSVEPILAESIEVLRGPSTLLYGGSAIGGVVNVIDNRIPTQQADGLTGAGEIRHGSVDDETTAVMKVEGGSGPFAFHLNGIKRDTNDIDIPGYSTNPDFDTPEGEKGTIGNTDSDLNAFTFGASFVGENGFFGLSYSDLSNDYGLPEGSHGHHHHDEEHDDEDHHDEDEHGDEDHHDEDEHEDEDHHDEDEHGEEEEEEDVRLDIEQTRYDLRGGLTNIDGLLDEMRVAVTYTDYEHIEFEGTSPGTRFSNETVEGRLVLVHDEINGFGGALGLQFEDNDFSAIGDESFIPETNTTSYGIFLVEDLHVDEDVYEFGIRFDRDEFEADLGNDESFDSLSLSAAGHWKVADNWHLGAALSSSERAPVVEELYSNEGNEFGDYVEHIATARIEVGDSDLDNEQANNLDLSVHYHTDNLDVNVSLYYNDFSDYIYLANGDMEQDEVDVYFFRQEDAKFFGIEFDVTTALGQALGGDFELRVFGDTITGELDSSGDVPRLPPMRIGSEINFIAGPFSSYVAVLNAADQDNPGDFENETDGYTRWDAGMDYRFGDIDAQNALVFLKLKNISDEEIRHSVSTLRDQAPEAGRSVVAGVRFSF